VKEQTVKRMLKLQSWAAQVDACRQSGQTVRRWCKENGITTKAYYYHQKRVREEMLDAVETKNGPQMARLIGTSSDTTPGGLGNGAELVNRDPDVLGRPVFAALPMPQSRGAAVTVRIGDVSVDIQNDADDVLVEQVLHTVARL